MIHARTYLPRHLMKLCADFSNLCNFNLCNQCMVVAWKYVLMTNEKEPEKASEELFEALNVKKKSCLKLRSFLRMS